MFVVKAQDLNQVWKLQYLVKNLIEKDVSLLEYNVNRKLFFIEFELLKEDIIFLETYSKKSYFHKTNLKKSTSNIEQFFAKINQKRRKRGLPTAAMLYHQESLRRKSSHTYSATSTK